MCWFECCDGNLSPAECCAISSRISFATILGVDFHNTILGSDAILSVISSFAPATSPASTITNFKTESYKRAKEVGLPAGFGVYLFTSVVLIAFCWWRRYRRMQTAEKEQNEIRLWDDTKHQNDQLRIGGKLRIQRRPASPYASSVLPEVPGSEIHWQRKPNKLFPPLLCECVHTWPEVASKRSYNLCHAPSGKY